MLSPDWDRAGIGIAKKGDTIYVVQVFADEIR